MPNDKNNVNNGGLFSALAGGTPAFQRSNHSAMISTGPGHSSDNPAAMSTVSDGSRALPNNTRRATSHTRRSSNMNSMATVESALNNANRQSSLDMGALKFGNSIATMTTKLEAVINRQSAMIEKQTNMMVSKLELINKSMENIAEMIKKSNDTMIRAFDDYNKKQPPLNWYTALMPTSLYKTQLQIFQRFLTDKVTLSQLFTAFLGSLKSDSFFRRLFNVDVAAMKEDKRAMPWTRENSTALVKTIPNAMKEMDKTLKNNAGVIASRIDTVNKNLITFTKIFTDYAAKSFVHYGQNEYLLSQLVSNTTLSGGVGVKTAEDVRTFSVDFNKYHKMVAVYFNSVKELVASSTIVFRRALEHLISTGQVKPPSTLPYPDFTVSTTGTSNYLYATTAYKKMKKAQSAPGMPLATKMLPASYSVKDLAKHLKDIVNSSDKLKEELKTNTGEIKTSSSVMQKQITGMMVLSKTFRSAVQNLLNPKTLFGIAGRLLKLGTMLHLAGVGFGGLRWLRDNSIVRSLGDLVTRWVWNPAKHYLVDPLLTGISNLIEKHFGQETMNAIRGFFAGAQRIGGVIGRATMSDDPAERMRGRKELGDIIFGAVGRTLKEYVVPPLTKLAIMYIGFTRAVNLLARIPTGLGSLFSSKRTKAELEKFGSGKAGLSERLHRFTTYDRIATGGTSLRKALTPGTGASALTRVGGALGGVARIGAGALGFTASMFPVAMIFKTIFSDVLMPFLKKKGISASDSKGISSAIKDFATSTLKTMFGTVSDLLRDAGGVSGVVSTLISATGGLLDGIFESLKEMTGAKSGLDLAGKVTGMIVGMFWDIISAVGSAIGSGLKNVWRAISIWIYEKAPNAAKALGFTSAEEYERQDQDAYINKSVMAFVNKDESLRNIVAQRQREGSGISITSYDDLASYISGGDIEKLKADYYYKLGTNVSDDYFQVGGLAVGVSASERARALDDQMASDAALRSGFLSFAASQVGNRTLSREDIARKVLQESAPEKLQAIINASKDKEARDLAEDYYSYIEKQLKLAEDAKKAEEERLRAEQEARNKQIQQQQNQEDQQGSFRARVVNAIDNIKKYFTAGSFKKDLGFLTDKVGGFIKSTFAAIGSIDAKGFATSAMDSIGGLAGNIFGGIMGNESAFDFFADMEKSAAKSGNTSLVRFAQKAQHTIASDIENISEFTEKSSATLERIEELLAIGQDRGWSTAKSANVRRAIQAGSNVVENVYGEGGSATITPPSMGTITDADIAALQSMSGIAVKDERSGVRSGSVYAAGLLIPQGDKSRVRLAGYFGEKREDHTHAGIDISHYPLVGPAPNIIAPLDGTVVDVGVHSGYGRTVILRHDGIDGKTYTTLYGHLDAFRNGLHVGEHVSAGTVLGVMGGTGTRSKTDKTLVRNKYDRHLHFGVAEGKSAPFNFSGAMDPIKFLSIALNYRKSLSTETSPTGAGVVEIAAQESGIPTSLTGAGAVEGALNESNGGQGGGFIPTISTIKRLGDLGPEYDSIKKILGTGTFDKLSEQEKVVLAQRMKYDPAFSATLNKYDTSSFLSYDRWNAAVDVVNNHTLGGSWDSIRKEIAMNTLLGTNGITTTSIYSDPHGKDFMEAVRNSDEVQQIVNDYAKLSAAERTEATTAEFGEKLHKAMERNNELSKLSTDLQSVNTAANIVVANNSQTNVAASTNNTAVSSSSNAGDTNMNSSSAAQAMRGVQAIAGQGFYGG